jgi:hypothetical protein
MGVGPFPWVGGVDGRGRIFPGSKPGLDRATPSFLVGILGEFRRVQGGKQEGMGGGIRLKSNWQRMAKRTKALT